MQECNPNMTCIICLPSDCYFAINFASSKTICWPNDKIPGTWDKVFSPGDASFCPTPTPRPGPSEASTTVWPIVSAVLFGILVILAIYLLRKPIKAMGQYTIRRILGFRIFFNELETNESTEQDVTNEDQNGILETESQPTTHDYREVNLEPVSEVDEKFSDLL